MIDDNKNDRDGDLEGLQFDRADYGEDGANQTCCTSCSAPINEAYFQHDGNVICTQCRDDLIAKSSTGLPLGRFFRALVYGSIAGLLGASLWYVIFLISGYEFGLIAIVVGLLVGVAVKSGSGGRGGLLYQCLAVVLTYISVTISYFPLLYAEIQNYNHDISIDPSMPQIRISFEKDGRLTVNDESLDIAAAKTATGNVIDKQGYLLICFSDLTFPDEESDYAGDLGCKTYWEMAEYWSSKNANIIFYTNREFKHRLEIDSEESNDHLVSLLVKIIVVAALCIMSPFFSGLENIIGFLIIGFALFEAWKINKKNPLDITGPFFTGRDALSIPAEGIE